MSHRPKEKDPEVPRDRGGDGTDDKRPMKEERTTNQIDEMKSKHKHRRVKDIAETKVCNRRKISRKSAKKGKCYLN